MAIIRPKSVEQQRLTGWLIVAAGLAFAALEGAGVNVVAFVVDFLDNR